MKPLKGDFLSFLKAIPEMSFCSYLSGDLFIFYPFFRIFSDNKWGLSIPCIIATILGFYLLYLICRRYFKSIWGYLVTFTIVCFNATLIFHATEIRAYAFLPTAALATLYVLLKIVDSNFDLSTSKRVGAIIFFVLVIWFHVYGIVMFGSCLLFVLLTKYKENDFKVCLKNAFIFSSIVMFFAMPFWLYCVLGPNVGHAIGHASLKFDPFRYIPGPIINPIGFIKGIFCNLIGNKNLYFLLIGVFFPFFVPYKGRRDQISFLVLVVLLPIGLILLSAVMKNYWFLQRQFVWSIPLFALYLGWSWESLINYVNKNKWIKRDQ